MKIQYQEKIGNSVLDLAERMANRHIPITINVICYEEINSFFNFLVGSNAGGNGAGSVGATDAIAFS